MNTRRPPCSVSLDFFYQKSGKAALSRRRTAESETDYQDEGKIPKYFTVLNCLLQACFTEVFIAKPEAKIANFK